MHGANERTQHYIQEASSFFLGDGGRGGAWGWIIKLLFLYSHHVLSQFSKFPMCSPRPFSIAPQAIFHISCLFAQRFSCFLCSVFLCPKCPRRTICEVIHTRIFFLDACLAEQSWGGGAVVVCSWWRCRRHLLCVCLVWYLSGRSLARWLAAGQ